MIGRVLGQHMNLRMVFVVTEQEVDKVHTGTYVVLEQVALRTKGVKMIDLVVSVHSQHFRNWNLQRA